MTELFKLDRYVILHLCDVSSSEDTGLMLGAEKIGLGAETIFNA